MTMPILALVDDDDIIRTLWTRCERGRSAETRTFSSPEEFIDAFDSDSELRNRLQLVVTDFHFDERTEIDGLGFCKRIRNLVHCPIFLSSTEHFDESVNGSFDAVIEKRPRTYADLQTRYLHHAV
jgi:CheY-like chemotaxis protein